MKKKRKQKKREMKPAFKNLYRNTSIGKYVIQACIDVNMYYWRYLCSDKKVIKHRFKKSFGYPIDLNNPQTLNEKINWLKLNNRTPLHTLCADKYRVREFISETIGDEYLIPLLMMSENPEDIRPENLPPPPFVIKTNHDSGGVVIVKDKKEIDWPLLRKDLKKRIGTNYYLKSKEWQYKNIVPCIIVEKFISDETGSTPFDYKLHSLNGVVKMIQVDMGRGTDYHYRNWYDPQWNRAPYRWSSKKGFDKFTHPSDTDAEKPANLEKMIELTEIISKKFIYSRIDWYSINGRLYFGEITFHHDSGLRPIEPKEWDLKLGKLLKLPAN